MIDYAAIGIRIKRLRMQKHMTQEELGEQIGLSSKHVSNIETNKARPSIESLVAIANVLGTTTDYLLMEAVDLSHDLYIQKEILDLLEGCSNREKKILLESLHALKNILQKC